MQAWAFEQESDARRKFESQDVMVPWCLQRKFLDADSAALTAAHGVVDDTRGVVVFNRYCHVYVEGELQALFTAAGGNGVEVVDSYFDKSNWCIVVRKKAAGLGV